MSESTTMSALGVLAPLKKPWMATMVATTKTAKASNQWPATAPIANPMRMLATCAQPTTTRCTKRSYIASCAGRSLPSAVEYSTGPWAAIHASNACSGGRGLPQLPREGNGSVLGGGEAGAGKCRALPRADPADREILDRRVEQLVEIELGAQMQEHRAEPDRRAVHEHEFARHRHRSLLLERLMHAERLAPAVFRRLDAVGEAAHAVVEQRPVDEPRPDVEHVDQFPVEPLEAPGLVGVHDEVVVAFQQPVVEVDDAADECRRKDADAAVIEEIDPRRPAVGLEHRVVAEMRITVDHAETAERPPPRREHRGADAVAGGEIVVRVLEQPAAVEPVEGDEPAGRELGPHPRHPDLLDACEHRAVERDVLGLAAVIELLADAGADLLGHLGGVDHRIHAAVDGEHQLQLVEIGLDRRLHVGILQLAGELGAAMGAGAVHLAERGDRKSVV